MRHRVAVESKLLASVGHDPVSQVLEVEFCNGSVYEYYEVPDELFSALLTAESPGTFFLERIRDGFKYRRMRLHGE